MKQKLNQILAILALIIIAILIVTTVIFAITGNPDFWGVFGLTLVFPIILFVLSLIIRLFR